MIFSFGACLSGRPNEISKLWKRKSAGRDWREFLVGHTSGKERENELEMRLSGKSINF